MPKFLSRFLPLLFLAVFRFSTLVNGQTLDSLRGNLQRASGTAEKASALAKFSFALASSHPDSAMLLAKQSLQLAQSLKIDSLIAASYNSIGWCYFRLGSKDSAEYFLEKARSGYHELRNANEEGKCLVNLSSVHNEYHEYAKSLTSLITARTLLEKANNETMLAYIDRTVGVVYRQQGMYDKSAQYFRSAIATFKRLQNFSYLADTYTSYGSVFWQENNYDSALYYYRNAYTIYRTKTNNIIGKAYAAENIANAFYKKANEQNVHPWIDSAYFFYTAALNAFIKIGGEENIKFEQTYLAETLRILGQYETAAKYLDDSFRYFDSAGDVTYAYNTADGLSRLYKDQGDYKKAYEYALLAGQYKDTLDDRNRADSIAKMFAEYETEKK
ncbi:MAG TPA: tetratricopeptide repeat protein, partial [Parafilimonas sp.]|nr:tetratricopeptide repeat protein [Parafilimonas sp.]